MCKILGIGTPAANTNETVKGHFQTFVSAMVSAMVRDGADKDATGVFAWNGGECYSDNMPVPANVFVEKSCVWKHLVENPAKLYLIHARGAMFGDAENPLNNHPFVGKNVALAHVGWLEKHKEIAEEHDLTLDGECDSEVFLRYAEQLLKKNPNVHNAYSYNTELFNGTMAIANQPSFLAMMQHSLSAPALLFGRRPGDVASLVIAYSK